MENIETMAVEPARLGNQFKITALLSDPQFRIRLKKLGFGFFFLKKDWICRHRTFFPPNMYWAIAIFLKVRKSQISIERENKYIQLSYNIYIILFYIIFILDGKIGAHVYMKTVI